MGQLKIHLNRFRYSHAMPCHAIAQSTIYLTKRKQQLFNCFHLHPEIQHCTPVQQQQNQIDEFTKFFDHFFVKKRTHICSQHEMSRSDK